MIKYSHTFDLPRGAIASLNTALSRFSDHHEVHVDSWYHDMPIWMIRQERGNLTVMVQIDALIEQNIGDDDEDLGRDSAIERVQLHFGPDSYEDIEVFEYGVKLKLRRLPRAETVRESSHVIAIPTTVAHESLEAEIFDALTSVWNAAERLPHDDIRLLSAHEARGDGRDAIPPC